MCIRDRSKAETGAHQRHALVAHAELERRAGGNAHQRRVVEMLAHLRELGLEAAIALMGRIVGGEHGAGVRRAGELREHLGGGRQVERRCDQLRELARIEAPATGVAGIEHGDGREADIGLGEFRLVARLENGQRIVVRA